MRGFAFHSGGANAQRLVTGGGVGLQIEQRRLQARFDGFAESRNFIDGVADGDIDKLEARELLELVFTHGDDFGSERLACLIQSGAGVVGGEIDPQHTRRLRASLPALEHRTIHQC